MDKPRHRQCPDATREGVRYLFADERVEYFRVSRDADGWSCCVVSRGRAYHASGPEVDDVITAAIEQMP